MLIKAGKIYILYDTYSAIAKQSFMKLEAYVYCDNEFCVTIL